MEQLVTRDKKVAYLGCQNEEGAVVYHRMRNFTAMTKASNPNEYSRKYVDEGGEVTDVTGYSPSIEYTFDLYTGNPVHEEIVKITDNEVVGSEAVRKILTIDFTKPGTTADSFSAILRDYAIIPGTEGEDASTYTYTGTFKKKSEISNVEVVTTDEWETCTILNKSENLAF